MKHYIAFSLALCLLKVQSLKLVTETAAHRAEAFIQNNAQCVDQSAEKIRPLVATVPEYFKAKGITPTPFALTALSALRFGGLAMSFKGEQKKFDHDLDILLNFEDGKNHTPDEVQDLIADFASHVTKQTGVKTTTCNNYRMPDPRGGQAKGTKVGENGAFHYFVFADMTDVETANALNAIWYANLPTWARPFTKVLTEAIPRKHFDNVCDCVLKPSNWCRGLGDYFFYDFWVDFEHKVVPQIAKEPLRNSKQLLLAGIPFDNLATEDTLAYEVQHTICSEFDASFFGKFTTCRDIKYCDLTQMGTYAQDLSDFKAFEFDKANSEAVVKNCAKMLAHYGFLSLDNCYLHDN